MSIGDLIKQHSIKSINSLKLTSLMEAEVVSDPPDLKIKLKGNDKLIIPKELIVVAEHLCRQKRTVTITNSGKTEIKSSSVTGKTGQISLVPPPPPPNLLPPHTHDMGTGSSLTLTSGDFTLTEGEIQFLNKDKKEDLLKKGDKVMVLSFEGGQKFFIIDRIFTY